MIANTGHGPRPACKAYVEDVVNKFVSAILIAAASVYTLMIVFLVVFTIGFFGAGGIGENPGSLAIFCSLALSPLVVCYYCLRRASAWRRGKRPPV